VFFEGTLFETIRHGLVVPTLVVGAEVLHHLKVADLGRNRLGNVVQVVGLILVAYLTAIRHSERQAQVSLTDVHAFVPYQVKILELA